MAKGREGRYREGRALAEDLEDLLADRRPRHRAGWVMPDLGDGTVVRQRRPSADDLPELSLIEEAPGRGRGARPAMVLALSTVAFGGVLYSSAFWRDQLATGLHTILPFRRASPLPLPSSRAGVEPPPSTPPPDGARTVWTGLAVPAHPLGTLPSPPPAPAPSPSPEAAPSPAPSGVAAPKPVDAPAPATSRLSISLEHGLKAGRVRVLVDGRPVLDEKLTSRVRRELLLFKVRSGSFEEVLPLPAGRRRVRVEVTAAGVTRAAEIAGTFRAGAGRRLTIEVGKKGEPSLAWK